MKFSNPRIEQLKELMSLEEKRASLQQELDALQGEISSLQQNLFNHIASGSSASAAKPTRLPGSRGKKAPRGSLKETILSALEAAGPAGVRVKELAEALGTKAVNIHSWFHSTGKRNPAIVKVAGGHYRLDGSASSTAQGTEKTRKSAGKAKSKATKSKAAKGTRRGRGSLGANILQLLQAAGPEGIAVKEIAEKVGAQYRNISIWFSTTGKKNASITKVGPARYRASA